MYSIKLYFQRNKTQVALVTLLMAAGVAGSLILASIFGSFGDTRTQLQELYEQVVTARLYAPIDLTELDSMQAKLITEVSSISIGYRLLGAAVCGFAVYGPPLDTLPLLLNELDLSLSAGRLPERSGEIVLPMTMLKANDKRVGDIWEERNPYLSTGDYLIVGALSGRLAVGFMHPDTTEKAPQMLMLLGDSKSLETELRTLLRGKASIQGPSSAAAQFRKSYSSFILISLASSLGLSMLITAALTLLSREEFKNRQSELGVLSVIGYPSSLLYRRRAIELCFKMFGGWALGIVTGGILTAMLRVFIFAPAGMALRLGLTRALPTLLIPVVVFVCSMWQLAHSFRGDPLHLLNSFAGERKVTP